MDPEKRPSADSVLAHAYFDEVRHKERSLSPRPHEKRVHSSTYRTNKYSTADGEEELDNGKRHPSHSHERNSQMRATGIFGTQDLRALESNTSQLSVNPSEAGVGEKKKSFGNTKVGFLIKEAHAQRKEGSSYGKKEEKESSKHEFVDAKPLPSQPVQAAAAGRRKVPDPKKSTANLKMFRIRRAA